MTRHRWLVAPALALAVLGAAPRDPLPDVPTTVFSKRGPIPVRRVPVVVCPDSSGTTPPRVVGCYTPSERVVQIADTLSRRWAWIVFFHEKTHVAFREVGVRFDQQDDEERICWALAAYQVAELEGR